MGVVHVSDDGTVCAVKALVGVGGDDGLHVDDGETRVGDDGARVGGDGPRVGDGGDARSGAAGVGGEGVDAGAVLHPLQ